MRKDETDKCYLTYSDELDDGGYLICTYNHSIDAICLMERNEESESKLPDPRNANQPLTVDLINEVKKGIEKDNILDNYAKQMQEARMFKVDKTFWLVVKKKPKWMPDFLYKAVIKNLVEFHHYK